MFVADRKYTFSSVLLYGNELSLIIFEILLMAFVDGFFKNYFIDSIVNYLVVGVSKSLVLRGNVHDVEVDVIRGVYPSQGNGTNNPTR
jgi:hypothetical protein